MHISQIIIDNEHIQSMINKLDLENENASSEEKNFDYLKINSEDSQYISYNCSSYHDQVNFNKLNNKFIALKVKSSDNSDSDSYSLINNVLYSSLDSNLHSIN